MWLLIFPLKLPPPAPKHQTNLHRRKTSQLNTRDIYFHAPLLLDLVGDEPAAHFAFQLKNRSVLEPDCHADCQIEPEGQAPAGWHLVQNPLTLRGQIPWAPSHSHAELDDLLPDGNGYNASFR